MGWQDDVAALESRLGHVFKDRGLLEKALTHVSFEPGSKNRPNSYERLEFLGDRVLGLSIADMLFSRFPHAAEGQLARGLADLVRVETCASIAEALDVGPCIRMGKGESKGKYHRRPVVLGDVCEALLGALFLDGGFPVADHIIKQLWSGRVAEFVHNTADPKTMLQEWAHAKGLTEPKYTDLSRSGPEHKPTFVVRAHVQGFAESEGSGPTKRAAERAAAVAMLRREGVQGVLE